MTENDHDHKIPITIYIKQVQITTVTSLSGGQGKTTTVFFLGLALAKKGIKTLWIDGDPQHNLTLYGRSPHKEDEPTLLECLTKAVKPIEAVYKTQWDNLYIMPSDRALEQSQTYLANESMGERILHRRIKDLPFDVILIDSQPGRSQLCSTCICAAEKIIIPVESNSKGLVCLQSTLETIEDLTECGAFEGKVAAIVPFRDTIRGINRTKISSKAIAYFQKVGEETGIKIAASIVDSEKYKQAIDAGIYLPEELEQTFTQLTEVIND